MPSQGPNAVFVQKRREPSTVDLLGIECDEVDAPVALRGETPDSWWIAEQAGFFGQAQNEVTGEVAEGSIGPHSAALAITSERLLGIIAPDDYGAAALWFSLPLAELEVQTEGSKGLLRKRPEIITLSVDGSEVTLGRILRLWRNSGNAQPWQEKAFVEALSGSGA